MQKLISSAKIGNITVKIISGDITREVVDAYLVPQFNKCASYGGVGGAISKAGGIKGLNAYHEYVMENGVLPFGRVHVTETGGGNAKLLLNTVSVGADKEEEYQVVHNCVYLACKCSSELGLKTVACPAMGTGIIGQLTDKQSALAIFSAIQKFTAENKTLQSFNIVIFDNEEALKEFSSVLSAQIYVGATPQTGERKFDIERWVSGMKKDGVNVKLVKGPSDSRLN